MSERQEFLKEQFADKELLRMSVLSGGKPVPEEQVVRNRKMILEALRSSFGDYTEESSLQKKN